MIWQIIKKEFLGYFYSPIGMIVLAVFAGVAGLYFFSAVMDFLLKTTPSQFVIFIKGYNVNTNLLIPFFTRIQGLMVIVIPVITMRLFAEERRQGTFELLLSYPIRPVHLLVGKYLGAFLFTLILLAVSAIYPLYVVIFSDPNVAPILTTYLGFVLLFSFYVAAGTFASSVTDNQIIAAILCLAIALSFMIVHWFAVALPSPFSEVFQHLLLFSHMASFYEGVVFWGYVVVYPSAAAFFLYLTYLKIRVTR